MQFYLEIPQTSWAITNKKGNAYNLMTFHRPSDLGMLSPTDVKEQLLEKMQDGPVELMPASFGLRTAPLVGSQCTLRLARRFFGWCSVLCAIPCFLSHIR